MPSNFEEMNIKGMHTTFGDDRGSPLCMFFLRLFKFIPEESCQTQQQDKLVASIESIIHYKRKVIILARLHSLKAFFRR